MKRYLVTFTRPNTTMNVVETAMLYHIHNLRKIKGVEVTELEKGTAIIKTKPLVRVELEKEIQMDKEGLQILLRGQLLDKNDDRITLGEYGISESMTRDLARNLLEQAKSKNKLLKDWEIKRFVLVPTLLSNYLFLYVFIG